MFPSPCITNFGVTSFNNTCLTAPHNALIECIDTKEKWGANRANNNNNNNKNNNNNNNNDNNNNNN